MRNKGSAGEDGGVSDQMDNDIEKQSVEDKQSCVVSESGNSDQSNLTIVICNGGAATEQPVEMLTTIDLESPKKPHLSRNSSSQEQCRVCQQDKEEELIILGCECKGGLSKAHRSCINTWFNIKGTNKCEICQHVASNVAPPAPLPTPTYWIWRVDPDFRGIAVAPERDRRACFSPLWVAFSILIGGLLLDVLISVTLGVSALPVNIIIGVIVVLGLGTALRLALEFCHEWSVRRVVHRTEANTGIGYHPTL